MFQVVDAHYLTRSKLFRIDTTDVGFDELNAGNTNIEEYIDKINLTSQDIEGFKIKGLWYFDKRQGELKYRLLALAPVAPDVQIMGRDDMDVSEQLALFWVWFPDARNTLHNMKVFNQKNSAYPISFDHEYVKGNALFQVMESNKIKDEIRNKELDMWNY